MRATHVRVQRILPNTRVARADASVDSPTRLLDGLIYNCRMNTLEGIILPPVCSPSNFLPEYCCTSSFYYDNLVSIIFSSIFEVHARLIVIYWQLPNCFFSPHSQVVIFCVLVALSQLVMIKGLKFLHKNPVVLNIVLGVKVASL